MSTSCHNFFKLAFFPTPCKEQRQGKLPQGNQLVLLETCTGPGRSGAESNLSRWLHKYCTCCSGSKECQRSQTSCTSCTRKRLKHPLLQQDFWHNTDLILSRSAHSKHKMSSEGAVQLGSPGGRGLQRKPRPFCVARAWVHVLRTSGAAQAQLGRQL